MAEEEVEEGGEVMKMVMARLRVAVVKRNLS